MDKKLVQFTKSQSKGTSMLRFIPILALFALLFTAPAQAVEINDEGAERLVELISSFDIKREDIIIEQADTYYAVTLPAAIYPILAPQKEDKKKQDVKQENKPVQNLGSVQVGIIAINAVPLKDPNDWKLSIALPTSISFSNAKGEKTLDFNIGSQRMGGVWDGELEAFSKLSARYKDLSLTDNNGNELLTLGQFDIVSGMKDKGDNLWDSAAKYKLSNLSFKTRMQIITLDKMGLSANVKGLIPMKRSEILALIAEKPESILATLFKHIGDASSLQTTIEGFQSKSHHSSNELTLESGSFSFHAKDVQAPLSKETFQIGYKGFSRTSEKGNYDNIIPSKANIKFDLDNLPLQEILEIGSKAVQSNDDNPKNSGANQIAMLQAMMTLPQILSTAGTTLTLTDTYSGHKDYNINLNGALKANPLSALGATGDLTVTILGMNNLIAGLEKSASNASSRNSQRITNTVQQLKLLDKITKTDAGTNICKFKLDDKAKVTMNGQDINALMAASKQQQVQ